MLVNDELDVELEWGESSMPNYDGQAYYKA